MRSPLDWLRPMLVALLLVPCGWHAWQQVQEDRVVRGWLEENGLAGLPPTRETAIRVQQVVRSQFNCDEDTWKAYGISGRPFLRHDVGWLLEHREGLCGEGARLLVVTLHALGIDAVRIVLYDRYLRTHALVSIVADGRETLLDSINTPEDLNAFLNSYPIEPAHLSVVRYDSDLAGRAEAGERVGGGRPDVPTPTVDGLPFFDKYLFYSYDGVPYTKLASAVGLDVRAFNLRRPPTRLGVMAEKPHAVMSIGWGAVAVGLSPIVLLVRRPRRDPAIVPSRLERAA